LIKEPGSQYVGHVTPKSGSALDINESILEYVAMNVPGGFNDICVIGSDGTVVNTGINNSVSRRLELKLNRPLQWVICLLHFNELSFRHLFQHIDGTTTGPNFYSGPIGTKLLRCEGLPVVRFQAVDCNLPVVDLKILSKDQQYLLQIIQAVKRGNPSDLARRDPGSVSLTDNCKSRVEIVHFHAKTVNRHESISAIYNENL